jgi:hypothetical protein
MDRPWTLSRGVSVGINKSTNEPTVDFRIRLKSVAKAHNVSCYESQTAGKPGHALMPFDSSAFAEGLRFSVPPETLPAFDSSGRADAGLSHRHDGWLRVALKVHGVGVSSRIS